ncbi:nuclear transport factor 2 family protein [Sphingomonas sp. So64.6b]|uniref:nuclear transport factor 2 family protein n=1 Tax=Sphingomonas sp. So64.6b TaxID=2997354 RepID=UPI00160454F9|nr:nuclear transport factor 2 family protein [Sphingomonas sp. So64.6b]QNA85542.1 nuclear transport factor 2 family protein [Sphingomonas sp. So64.6b]
MIFPDKWAASWIEAWNRRDLDDLIGLYGDGIHLRSPFAKVYAEDGVIKGKEALRSYWGEVMRRIPELKLELVAVYTGHLALSFHYRDNNGRNCLETILFDERDKAIFETACLDRLR